MTSLFDSYIMVDWSASSTPVKGANSIWIGHLQWGRNDASLYRSVNPHTRHAAFREIKFILTEMQRRGARTLLGFDFALGYPAGTADALGLDVGDAAPWQQLFRLLTDRIEDSNTNRNNRFAVASDLNRQISNGAHPFWGVPPQQTTPFLKAGKGNFDQPGSPQQHRLTEAWIRQHFRGSPKSVWQLAYTGSVGSQSLMGIPVLETLRSEIPNTQLWPFETGLRSLHQEDVPPGSTLIAEIYPSILNPSLREGDVLDSAQVRALTYHFSQADQAGRLSTAFSGDNSLSARKRAQIEQEEGWILAI